MSSIMPQSAERDIGGKTLTLEAGKYASQANAAVTVRCGDSMILATVCVSPDPRPNIDFLPLTVDYEERLYAAGKIPGSFFRREGRPGQDAILFGRLIDRPLRPLFPKGFYNDVQIIITVLSVDMENPPEVLGIIGASAALSISDIPFDGPVGASRVATIGDGFAINPTYAEINQTDLSVVVAGTRDGVMMVEAGSTNASEQIILEAISRAQEANTQVTDMIDELVASVGKSKMSLAPEMAHHDLEGEINTILNGRLLQILDSGRDKPEREHALRDIEAEVQERLVERYSKEAVAASFETVLKQAMRSRILDEGRRPDGRGLTDIRPISCQIGILPRSHGSGLFTRGQTQVLTVATLASMGMKQKLDNLSPEGTKRFIHHYNFTPFSTGEVKRIGTGRREVGHGALAEKAIQAVVPSEEEFPYAIRLVSEVLSSNGSTSMASVCASSLALMDAGVPVKGPVAGVAMGLVMGENGRYATLTDIEGMEDHLGDMDFKVAGTAQGINALQMDVKAKGLTFEILEQALRQAREGRLFILAKMQEAIAEPKPQVSPYAPKMIRMVIPASKIGVLIGPGGKTIRALQEETGATIDVEDDGTVLVGSRDEAMMQLARNRIEGLTRELAVGDIFTGKVMRVVSFGAFLELLPGKEGLLRMGEMAETESSPRIGQEITVIVQEIDHLGRVNLSQRALQGGSETPPGSTGEAQGAPRERPGGGGPPFTPRRPEQRYDRRGAPGQGGSRPAPGQRSSTPDRPGFRDSPSR